MRIFDEDNQNVINNVSIFLTIDEAKEMLDSLDGLLKAYKNDADHTHINDETYQHEITLSLYDETNLKGFNERAKKIIKEDK
jgi:hypothetical protein